MQVTKFNLVTDLQIMLFNVTHSNFYFECNTERGSIDQLYIELGFSCGLETWYMSPGDTDWQPGQCLFTQKPAWIEKELPANDGAFWAPALISSEIMYYSVQSMEEDAQCIGLAFATGTVPNQKVEGHFNPNIFSIKAQVI